MRSLIRCARRVQCEADHGTRSSKALLESLLATSAGLVSNACATIISTKHVILVVCSVPRLIATKPDVSFRARITCLSVGQ